jgi:putative tryptophan/tyrosine transport system substrate-binding protein
MKRRDFIVLCTAGASWPILARAQQRPRKVGIVWHAGSAEEEDPYFGAFHRTMQELGYINGKTIELVDRFPDEKPEQFKNFVAELIALPVDVLVTVTLPAALVAQRQTKTIPIVFVLVSEPVQSGLVNSFARPGGNVTGLTQVALELSAKRLELLKGAFPRMARVGILVNANDQATMLRVINENKVAGGALGLEIEPAEVRSLDDFEPAVNRLADSHCEGIVAAPDGLTFQGRSLLAQLARARRLPLMMFSRESLVTGALMSFGPDYKEIFRRAAFYVDKILKGERPADLPVEAPTKFEFLVNLTTAKALGVELPPTMLTQADEVIE